MRIIQKDEKGVYNIVIAGKSGNVKYMKTGQNQTPLLKFALPNGRNDDDSVRWLNCDAWGSLANYGHKAGLSKGDNVAAFGTLESNEGKDGKTYTQLRCDALIVCKSGVGGVGNDDAADYEQQGFTAFDGDADDLPF